MSPRTSPWDDSVDEPTLHPTLRGTRGARVARFAFFAINFLISLGFCLQAIVTIAVRYDPQKLQIDANIAIRLLLGVLMMLPSAAPFAVYAWFEWRARQDRNESLVRTLGYWNLGIAPIVFLLVAAEGLQLLGSDLPVVPPLRSVLAGLALAIYLIVCGLFRIRRPGPISAMPLTTTGDPAPNEPAGTA